MNLLVLDLRPSYVKAFDAFVSRVTKDFAFSSFDGRNEFYDLIRVFSTFFPNWTTLQLQQFEVLKYDERCNLDGATNTIDGATEIAQLQNVLNLFQLTS